MAVDLPAPGEEPWGEKLNAAIEGVDSDLQGVKANVTGINADLQSAKTSLDSRLDTLEADGGGGEEPPTVVSGGSRFVPVVIFNGESNSGGYADNGNATPAELAPQPQIQIFDNINNASYQTMQIGVNNLLGHTGMAYPTHGWELGLANSVAAGEWWNDTLYLIKTGQGGSMISQWTAASAFYTTFLTRVRNGLAILRNQGLVPVIYLWYSLGVNDAINGTNEAAWLTQVKELHDRMRDELGYIPIIYTKLPATSSGVNYNDSIVQYGLDDNMVIPVEETGATMKDPNHWDYEGMKLMAARLCAASKAFGQHENYLLKQTAMLAGGNVLTVPTDLPALVRTPASVSFIEGSVGASFTVKLDRTPLANVVVTVAASGGNVFVDKPSLTFTPANFGTTQTVAVTSPNDNTNAGSRSSTITLSSLGVASSATVAVTVTDAFVALGPVNTQLPAISGTTDVGDSLSCSTGTWTGSPTGYTYQWKRDSLPISGATTNSYVIVALDGGHTLSCTITATNAEGSNTAAATGVSVPVDLGDLVPFTWQNLTNITEDGSHAAVVSAATTPCGANATTSIDVSGPFTVIIDWASSALASAYVAFLDDTQDTDFNWSNNYFTTGAYFVGGATANSATSGALAAVAWGWVPTYPCKIKMEKSGNDVVYSSSPDGVTWTQRYTHVGVLAGKTTQYIRVLSAAPTVGQKLTVYYDAAAVAPAAPANTVLPAVSGSTALDGVMTCSAGSWSGSPVSYAYQWKRNGTPISGATTNAHTIVAADQSNILSCTVTATNALGSGTATTTDAAIPAAGTPALATVTWNQFSNATSPQPGLLASTGTAPSGGMASDILDLTQPFELEVEFPSDTPTSATVVFIDDDNTQDYQWGGGQVYISGGYQYAGSYNISANGATPIPSGQTLTYPCKIKMSKSGNDITYSRADGVGAYGAPFYTHVGVLAGKTTGYIKALFAVAAVTNQIKARKAQ